MSFRIVIFFCLLLCNANLAKNVRIIGGTDTSIRHYPHMVSIRHFYTQMLICGGSIITKWNILTSAHCLHGLKDDYSNVRIYVGSRSSVSLIGPNFGIEQVHYHPKFKKFLSGDGILNYDICVIQLLRPIRFNEFQNKINISTRNIITGDLAVFTGWGVWVPHSTETSPRLKAASMIIYDHSDCLQKLSKPMIIHDDQFCTFNDDGYGICDGDSGGSVIYNQELVGIITDTFQCGEGLPDVHTNVYNYLDFITHHMIE